MRKRVWLCVSVISLFCLSATAALRFVDSPAQEPSTKYWVFFKDKGLETQKRLKRAYALAEGQLTARSLKRRAKVRARQNLVDYTDLPVNPKCIEAVKDLGFEPIVVSKWLNAISIRATTEDVVRLRSLPFVKKVQTVAVFVRKPSSPAQIDGLSKALQPAGGHELDYGSSYTQNALIHVPEVHDMGINGKGVLIAMLDTGFDYRDHEAFKSIHVIAEHDFINGGDITADEVGQDVPGQHNHGTMMLSIIGGFKNGELVGPAYGASFALAKTEYVPAEIRAEEDYWVAGIEWADSLGADIVSSSLGYTTFDDGTGYSYADLDGNTAITTVAADLAASKGIVVVNSMGNGGNVPGSIVAPADGDSVIAVGAVDSEGRLAGFSSIGPAYDGRIKPDVVAMGVAVVASSPYQYSGYVSISGTSASCPLVAGVCALILSVHPELTPMQVREALRMTASKADNPDNLYGWGLVNAREAVLYDGAIFGNPEIKAVDKTGLKIKIKIVSPIGINPDSVFIYIRGNEQTNFTRLKMSKIPDVNEYFVVIFNNSIGGVIKFYFSATDLVGRVTLFPVGAPKKLFTFIIPPGEYKLYQNYPNPFNSFTFITFDLRDTSRVSLKIFNVLGQKVVTLRDETMPAKEKHRVTWDGKDSKGRLSPSGIYFYRLQARGFAETKKMLLVR